MKFCRLFNTRYFHLHVDSWSATVEISRFSYCINFIISILFSSFFKVGADSPISVLQSWKTFCTCYFSNWCRANVACGLLIDSATQAVGVIRKSSVSMCRSLEDIELLVFGASNIYISFEF